VSGASAYKRDNPSYLPVMARQIAGEFNHYIWPTAPGFPGSMARGGTSRSGLAVPHGFMACTYRPRTGYSVRHTNE
jgi:hypothetical protein